MRRLLAVRLLTVLGCGLCLGCGVHVILSFLHGSIHSSLPPDSLLLYPAISVVTFISMFTFWQLLPCSRKLCQYYLIRFTAEACTKGASPQGSIHHQMVSEN